MHSYIKIPFDDHVTAAYTQSLAGDLDSRNKKFYFDIADDLQLDVERFFITNQILQADVCVVDPDMAGDGIIRDIAVNADAAVTDVPGITLSMIMSDCPPVYLYDPIRQVIGLVHSGRQGTALNIVAETIRVMRKAFGCDPSHIKAVIGPHICEKCYEVGEDVAHDFALHFPEAVRPSVVSREYGKLTINLDAAISYQLHVAGIEADKLTHIKECTYENPLLLSYRRGDGTRSDLAVMVLHNEIS